MRSTAGKQESEETMRPAKLDRRQKRSREALRNAFLELLKKKDLSQITVTEITKVADRDRKTFYLHYSSIDDLIDELLFEEVEREVDQLESLPLDEGGKINIAKLYEALGKEMLTNVRRYGGALKHIDASRIIETKRPLFVKALVERDFLGLSRTLGPYLDLFVTFFYSGLLALYCQWLSQDSDIPVEHFAELSAAAVTGGVTSLIKAAEGLHDNEGSSCVIEAAQAF